MQLADAMMGTVVETLKTTRQHPFFVSGKGFVPAGGLAVGNAIVTRAGPTLKVKSLKWHRRAKGYAVYNFEVESGEGEDTHNYFVGKASSGAWVHNGDCLLAGRMQTLDLKGAWKNATFREGPLVYVLRDGNTGELLKVGKTYSARFLGRFPEYAAAAIRNNRDLVVDVFEYSPSVWPGTVETQIRKNLERVGFKLPWDNTNRRLGRPGSGIP